jgi:hypothetical protein
MRSILLLVTVTDRGHISVDVRGPYSDKDSILSILEEARKLVEQGNFRDGKKTT